MEQKISKKPRRKNSPAFKAHVALGALAGDKTLVQLS
jgi:transposase